MESPSGPVTYKANVSVDLVANQQEYQIEERSPIERNFMVGLWVTKQGVATGINTTQAATAILDSIAITIRVEESDVVRKIYVHQIQAANDFGKPFYVTLPGPVNLSESKVECFNNSGIGANTVFEFQIDYLKPVKIK